MMKDIVRLLIVHPMDPVGKKIGGIQTFIKNLIKYSPPKFDIEFVGVSANRKERPIAKWQEVDVFGKNVKFLPLLNIEDENSRKTLPLSFRFTLALMHSRKRISTEGKVLHFHRIEPSLAFGSTGSKKILFVHGNMIDLYNRHSEVKWRSFPWLYFGLEKKLIRGFSKVFMVRQDGVELYRKKYPFMKERFAFLPTWADREVFYPYKQKEKKRKKLSYLDRMRLPISTKIVLFVGRLEGQKDPTLLIDTFGQINHEMDNTALIIVGTGRLRDSIEKRVVAKKLSEKVVFANRLAQAEVAELMRISDVFVMTSAFEGMPMVVIEALATGLPVVCTIVGEVERIIGSFKAGMIVRERNGVAIGGVVADLLRGEIECTANDCLESVKEFTAEKVLGRLYRSHYEL